MITHHWPHPSLALVGFVVAVGCCMPPSQAQGQERLRRILGIAREIVRAVDPPRPRYQTPRFAIQPPATGYPDPRYTDPRYTDPRHTDPRYTDPRYTDPRYTGPRYSGPQRTNPRSIDPRSIRQDDSAGLRAPAVAGRPQDRQLQGRLQQQPLQQQPLQQQPLQQQTSPRPRYEEYGLYRPDDLSFPEEPLEGGEGSEPPSRFEDYGLFGPPEAQSLDPPGALLPPAVTQPPVLGQPPVIVPPDPARVARICGITRKIRTQLIPFRAQAQVLGQFIHCGPLEASVERVIACSHEVDRLAQGLPRTRGSLRAAVRELYRATVVLDRITEELEDRAEDTRHPAAEHLAERLADCSEDIKDAADDLEDRF